MADQIDEMKESQKIVIDGEVTNSQNLTIGEADQCLNKPGPLGLYDSLRYRLIESETSKGQAELIRQLKAQL